MTVVTSFAARRAAPASYKYVLETDNLTKPVPPPTTERVDRSSFSSTKESHSGGIAQTFTESKTSSYLRNEYITSPDEDAILDDTSCSSGSQTPEILRHDSGKGMLTNPHSALHGYVCPCDGFKGWKDISIKGRLASKSFGDLKGLWAEDFNRDVRLSGVRIAKDSGRHETGMSTLEKLPMELLSESDFTLRS